MVVNSPGTMDDEVLRDLLLSKIENSSLLYMILFNFKHRADGQPMGTYVELTERINEFLASNRFDDNRKKQVEEREKEAESTSSLYAEEGA